MTTYEIIKIFCWIFLWIEIKFLHFLPLKIKKFFISALAFSKTNVLPLTFSTPEDKNVTVEYAKTVTV